MSSELAELARDDVAETAALHAICHARRVARELGADADYLEIEALA
jgi:hypothetical protein